MIKQRIEKFLSSYNDIIYSGLLIRRFEEKLLELFSRGILNGTVHTCIGQELIGACIASHLDTKDFIVTNHRGHGHYIAKTGDIKGLLCEIMGRETGVCGGMGGSQHIFADNFISNGVQGGMTPIAAGIALASTIRKEERVIVSFIGDGTLGQGIVYETLNICGKWDLPVLFVLENNGYAQSTSFKQSFSGDLKKRIEGFGITFLHTDTWNLDLLDSEIKKAIGIVRNGSPCFLEIETYRLMSHSKSDDNRSIEEIESYQKRDILSVLIAGGNNTVKEYLTAIDEQIEEAAEFAAHSPVFKMHTNEIPSTGTTDYSDLDTTGNTSDKRINELLYETFSSLCEEDENLVLLGEDIEYLTRYTAHPYGGAFKVTRDLSMKYGGRIRNTPISESAITGIGTGLALAGMKPIVEIMFGDFLTLTFDQIVNHASKFCSMFGQTVDVPLVVRTPMGGRRGYGPTHSQSLEKHFLGTPNLNIVALNNRISPAKIYESIHKKCHQPTLVIENKVLYTRLLNPNNPVGFKIEQTGSDFPTIRISANINAPSDLTIVCYGGMLEEVEEAALTAFEEEEILCEIICPTLINPLNMAPVLLSVKETEKLLIAEEGNSISALGSEIVANIVSNKIPLRSFTKVGANTVIPCSIDAENNLLPNRLSILQNIKELHYEG